MKDKFLPIVAGCTAIITAGINCGKTVKVLRRSEAKEESKDDGDRWWMCEPVSGYLLLARPPSKKGKPVEKGIAPERFLLRIDGGEDNVPKSEFFKESFLYQTGLPKHVNCRCTPTRVILPDEDK